MTIPMLLLTLVLNGTEITLTSPIMSAIDPDGTRQIMIPLRESFEAAGFVVQYHDRGEPCVDITAYVDRLPGRRHLVRHGTVLPGRAELRASEYVADLPFPVERFEGTLYAPAIVLRIIGGGDLSVDLDAETLHWDTYAPDHPPLLRVSELISDLPAWLHRRVRVEGTFHGPDAPSSAGPPAPGAWALSDATGTIYCTDALWTGSLHIVRPEVAGGQRIAVEGIMRPGWGGLPYLSVAEVIVPGDD